MSPDTAKVADIKEASINFEVPVTDQEIEAMLEASERLRKAKWEETLQRFGKSA